MPNHADASTEDELDPLRQRDQEKLDEEPRGKVPGCCCICCIVGALVVVIWIALVVLALRDLKSGCIFSGTVQAIRGLCEGTVLLEADVDLTIECTGSMGSADVSIDPGQPGLVELSIPGDGRMGSVAISLSPEILQLSKGTTGATARAVLDTATPDQVHRVYRLVTAYSSKQRFSVEMNMAEDSGISIAVNFAGVPVLPTVALSMLSSFEIVHELDFTPTESSAVQSVQSAVGLTDLSVVQNDEHEFKLSADFDIGVSALPTACPVLQLPPIQLEIRDAADSTLEPAMIMEIGGLDITETSLAADRLSLQFSQAAALRLPVNSVSKTADFAHMVLMSMGGAEAGNLTFRLTGAQAARMCPLERLLSHMSVDLQVFGNSQTAINATREEVSATAATDTIGEFDVALSAVTLRTSTARMGAVLILGEGTGRSLSSVIGAGWPELSLEGWSSAADGGLLQSFGLGLALASAPDSVLGGEVEVSVVQGSLSHAVTRWWQDLFGLHTTPLAWRLSCPGEEETVLGQLIASVRVEEVVIAFEAAAASREARLEENHAQEHEHDHDELNQIMGKFVDSVVASSTVSEATIDTIYELVLPYSLTGLLANTTVDETVHRDTSLSVSVVDVDSDGIALESDPVEVFTGQLVHASIHSLGLSASVKQPSTLGRLLERLAERKAVDIVVTMRADDGSQDNNGAFDTGGIALHVPGGWHHFSGVGSRMAVPCDATDRDTAEGDDTDISDASAAEGSILGPITVEYDWHMSSVDVSFTSSLMNPLPIPLTVSAFHFEIFHDDGDDELLAIATLMEPLTMPELNEMTAFTVITEVPYSTDILSAGLDYLVGDLVLGGRNGEIEFTLGEFFVVPIPIRHQNLVVSTCAAEAGVVDGQYFADGFCQRDTGEKCPYLACPVELGATDCTDTASNEWDRCDCAPGFCLIRNENVTDSTYVHGIPVCARAIDSIQPLADGTIPAGRWGGEVCEFIENYSVCDGVCAMQLSQTGFSSDGIRVTTRCVEIASQDCDCLLGWCNTERTCACERCTEVWMPSDTNNGRR